MRRVTFDTNIYLHSLDLLKDPMFDDVELVSLLPVISELDHIKVTSSRGDLKLKGRIATRTLKELVDKGRVKPLIVDNNIVNIMSLSKFDIIDDLILSICKQEKLFLVTMDYNVYLKALHIGVEVDFIEKEKKIENLSMVYKGKKPPIYVSKDIMDTIYVEGSVCLSVVDKDLKFYPNECVTLIDYSNSKSVRHMKYLDGRLHKIKYTEKSDFYGVKPRSDEQKFALGLLNDDSIKIVTLTGEAGSAKAQPNSTPIPTPSGWTTLGALNVGDKVFDRLGNITKVLGVYPQGMKPTYRVTLSDGRSTLCADEHLWDVYTRKTVVNKRKNTNTKPFTLTTLELKDRVDKSNKIVDGKRVDNVSVYIQNNGAVSYPKKDLSVDPYVVGVLLGDGCLTCCGLQMSSNEEDVVSKVAERLKLGYKHSGQDNYTWSFDIMHSPHGRLVKKSLKDMGLLVKAYEKHIPTEYMESSVEDRLELLKGLMDTDGSVGEKNRLSFSTTSPKLRDDFILLCRSLGFVTSRPSDSHADRAHPVFNVIVQTNEQIFSSAKHKKRWEVNLKKYTTGVYHNDFVRVTSVEEVQPQENTCIYVSNDEHLYLTEDYIVTHNTILSFAVGLEKCVDSGKKGKLYIAKPPVSLSNKLRQGFKKGTILEKAIESLGSYSTNLERMAEARGDKKQVNGKKILMDMLETDKITYLSLEDVLGMSFGEDDFIILDEAELLTKEEMKSVLTRGGKFVVIGDCEQNSELSGVDYDNSGLLHLIEVGKNSKLIAHLTLEECYRSEMVAEINKIW